MLRERSLKRSRQTGSTMLLFTTMLALVLVPLVGLAIDGTMCYIVQAKLSAAADGAALGAGRLLGTNANPQEIAGEFVRANFPTKFWGSTNLRTSVKVDHTFSTHTITVDASVSIPLKFLRVLRYNSATATAHAVSTRRDTRVMLVLDQSNSMTPSIGALRTGATTFVNKFTPNVDKLGLVAFGNSAFVAYPTTKTLSTTGPLAAFVNTPPNGQDNILTMISAMKPGGNTNTAEGLYLAWQELKTAHSLDNDTTRMNAIVLFTDGVPNGFTAYFNDPAGTSVKSSSTCSNKTATSTTSTQMKLWMAATCSGSCTGLQFFNPSRSLGRGIFVPITRDTTQNAKYWIQNPGDDTATSSSTNNCSHLNGTDVADLQRLPPTDLYGTSTGGTDWNKSLLYKTFSTSYNSNQPGNGYNVALASWNAVDNVAKRILADTTISIAIYCIGYTGNGGVDDVLLKRVANTLDSGAYDATRASGMYVAAADSNALQAAFSTVASEILRLAH